MKKQLGLTPAQWKVILVLNMMDGLTQREIAEKINIDGSTLVPVIDKMEQGGLVERKTDSNDRRSNRIFLTKKSESTVDSIILIMLQIKSNLHQEKPNHECLFNERAVCYTAFDTVLSLLCRTCNTWNHLDLLCH